MNMQMHRPRNDEEQDDATATCGEWLRRGSALVSQGKDTRTGRRRAELDYIVADEGVAWMWNAEVEWAH